jgi:hypothetical protein
VEAQERLDSLERSSTSANLFDRFVLMHNLAFHKDKKMRDRAEDLLKRRFPEKERSALVRAYAGSLQMIRVSHRAAGSKVLRTIMPFTKSPLTEGREGYHLISEALQADSMNVRIRLLRATAAAESAEHLAELFDSARVDLIWLEEYADPDDPVIQFLINLNWAKYYYKLARKYRDTVMLRAASEFSVMSVFLACTPVYVDWADSWYRRINALAEEFGPTTASESTPSRGQNPLAACPRGTPCPYRLNRRSSE